MVDASWALANRGDGTFDRWLLFGTTAPQYVTWFLGTVVGAYGGDLLGDTDRFGLDAVFPTFFLGILIDELRDPRSRHGGALRRGRSRWRWCRSPPPASRSSPLQRPHSWGCAGDDLVDDRRARRDHRAGQGGRAGRLRRPDAAPGVPAGGRDDGAGPAGRTGGHVRPRGGEQVGVGADTVGVLAGGVLLWRGHSVVLAVVVAVAVTATLRAIV